MVYLYQFQLRLQEYLNLDQVRLTVDNHLEVVFNIKSFDKNQQDILIGHLFSFGFDSFQQKESTLHAFIEESQFDKKHLEAYISKYLEFDIIDILKLENKNWNLIWEESFEPI